MEAIVEGFKKTQQSGGHQGQIEVIDGNLNRIRILSLKMLQNMNQKHTEKQLAQELREKVNLIFGNEGNEDCEMI